MKPGEWHCLACSPDRCMTLALSHPCPRVLVSPSLSIAVGGTLIQATDRRSEAFHDATLTRAWDPWVRSGLASRCFKSRRMSVPGFA